MLDFVIIDSYMTRVLRWPFANFLHLLMVAISICNPLNFVHAWHHFYSKSCKNGNGHAINVVAFNLVCKSPLQIHQKMTFNPIDSTPRSKEVKLKLVCEVLTVGTWKYPMLRNTTTKLHEFMTIMFTTKTLAYSPIWGVEITVAHKIAKSRGSFIGSLFKFIFVSYIFY